jgi:polyphosphate kinase
MFPVLQENLRKSLLENLSVYFKDTSNAWLLDSGGSWTRIEPENGEKAFRAQSYFLSLAAKVHAVEQPDNGEFIIRRSPISQK